MKREEAQQLSENALNELTSSLADGKSEQMQEFLAFAAKLHKYSWGNILLIFAQRPEATYVAGFKAWLSLGRTVKKGEKGIAILAPMMFKRQSDDSPEGEEKTTLRFRVTHVFDVSQTDGEEIPQPNGVQGDPAEKLAALEAVIANHGIGLREEHLPSAIAMSLKGEIVITPGLESGERFAVLAHELGHELLHDDDARKNDSKKVKETEAEAVAFVVASAFGLDTKSRSSDYISLYQGDGETIASSLDRIQKVGSHIIEEVSAIAATLPTLPASPQVAAETCSHTLQHVDENGELQGTWQVVDAGEQNRIECRVCSKFYGYAPKPATTPLVTGRADYQERKEARITRYSERAQRRGEEADQAHSRAKQMADAIPFGQPILVGHHSEGRDRRYREHIEKTFRKSFELSDKASYWASRAESAESNCSISSDDPEAIAKLNEKLEQMQHHQEFAKAINKAWRAAGRPQPENAEAWQKFAEHPELCISSETLEAVRLQMAKNIQFSAEHVPFPAYWLQNRNAEVRRIRTRIQKLTASASRTTAEVDHGVCRLVENAEQNRVQVLFDGKPPKETRDLLKRNGFRWSPREKAWQRMLNNSGLYAAREVVRVLTTVPSPEEISS